MTEVRQALTAAKAASRAVGLLSDGARQGLLRRIAAELRRGEGYILAANAADLAALPADYPFRDRLLLTPERVEAMAAGAEAVAELPDNLWQTLEERDRPSGIHLRRVRVPLGVVACIYEARPNVTVDVACLCLRTGNAAALKGGKEAARSNDALAAILAGALRAEGVPEAAVTLLPPTHEAADELMAAEGLVDVLIPRGSARLIRAVREQALVPVIETGAGVCHVYVHADADPALAARVIDNAKTRRVSVCNALDCLLVPEDWGREWLSMNLSVRVVEDLDEALAHIARFGSGHSEAIVTQSPEAAERFRREVDAACVYVNTPTSFTDGGEFGLGAEVGISTQKLHARGPMGLDALTTYKWLIDSQGATRP